MVEADPGVIFLTVCGYNVERTLGEIASLTKRKAWNDLRAVTSGRVYVLDGASHYSRSGPRLVTGPEIMAFLLHSELFPHYRVPDGSAYSLTLKEYVRGSK